MSISVGFNPLILIFGPKVLKLKLFKKHREYLELKNNVRRVMMDIIREMKDNMEKKAKEGIAYEPSNLTEMLVKEMKGHQDYEEIIGFTTQGRNVSLGFNLKF